MQRESELALKCARDSERRRVLKNLADRRIAPTLADVFPERLSVAVRKVFIRALRHLLDGREISVYCRVAEP